MAMLPLLVTYLTISANLSVEHMNFQRSTYNVQQSPDKLINYSDNRIRNSQICEIPVPQLDQITIPIINQYLKQHRPDYEYGNATNIWRVLRYNETGHFVEHRDRHRPVDGYEHIGTEIYLPPASMYQFEGGELEVKHSSRIDNIKPHQTQWTYIFMPLGILHKVKEITKGVRISYTKSIYIKLKPLQPQNPAETTQKSTQL